MGTRLIAKDLDAEDTAIEYLAPVRRGLECIHFINKKAAKAARNYAPGKANGEFIGTPLAADDLSIRMKGLSSYVQTQVREARAMTVFIVARTQDTLSGQANQPMFYGTFRSAPADGTDGTTYGVSMYSDSATTVSGGAGRGASVADHEPGGLALATSIGTWALYVHRVGVGSEERNILKNATTGAQSQNPIVTKPRYPSRGLLRIGSGYSQFSGHCDVAFFQAHSVELTTDEIDIIVADIRSHMARRGLNV